MSREEEALFLAPFLRKQQKAVFSLSVRSRKPWMSIWAELQLRHLYTTCYIGIIGESLRRTRVTRNQMLRSRKNGKKFPKLLNKIKDNRPGSGQNRVMFQDEARFGRISDTQRCWCPKPIRPLCRAMVTQQYTYAYAAVSVTDGVLDTLILPQVNSRCMQVFLDEVSSRHREDRIIMILDGAGWHKAGELVVPENMRLVSLPHYAPELNPVEHI